MFKHIWYLLTKQSKSQMKGMDMYWEWNWPDFWSSDSLTWFSFDFRTSIEGDHSPSLYGVLVVFNLKLLDFGYYNGYHEVEDPDDMWFDLETTVNEVVAGYTQKKSPDA